MTSKNAEDILLEKKAETQDGKVTGIIEHIGIVDNIEFNVTDSLFERSNGSQTLDLQEFKEFLQNTLSLSYTEYPNLNSFTEDNDFDQELFQEEIQKFTNSDNFKIDTEKFKLKSIQRIPGVGLHMKNTLGSEYSVFIDIFTRNDIHSIITSLNTKSEVDLDIKNEKIVFTDNTEIDCSIYSSNNLYKAFNFQKFTTIQDGFKNSNFNNWAKTELSETLEIDEEADVIEIKIPELDAYWEFNNPEFWDEEAEIVKLIENFASGHPSQLKNVLVKPKLEGNSSDINTVESTDSVWELALEEPQNEDKEKKSSSLFNIF